ncbi:MAG: Hsp20/alpha crystallin family protein [Chloroflexota bacterium]|jgi:HSP20 family protein
MAIVRWSPARELLSLQNQMDRLWEDAFGSSWMRRPLTWNGTVDGFPMDVYQTDKEYVVKASLPGVKPEDIDVNIVGETLNIKAEIKEEKDVKEENWLLKESRVSSFARSITLPSEVQADKVEATMENGILKLKLPKAEAVVPKTIKVKSA